MLPHRAESRNKRASLASLVPVFGLLALCVASRPAAAQFYNGPIPGTATIPVMTAPGMWAPGGFGFVVPYYDNYAYWEAQAAWNHQAMANWSLAQGSYDLASMNSGVTGAAGNLMNASLMQQFALSNKNLNAPLPRYNIETGSSYPGQSVGGTQRLADITSRGGDVLWPLTAPTDGDLSDRQLLANKSIREAVLDFRKSGRGSVEKVNTALRDLAHYAEPGLKNLKDHNPTQVPVFQDFTRSLERGLRKLVGDAPTTSPRAVDKKS